MCCMFRLKRFLFLLLKDKGAGTPCSEPKCFLGPAAMGFLIPFCCHQFQLCTGAAGQDGGHPALLSEAGAPEVEDSHQAAQSEVTGYKGSREGRGGRQEMEPWGMGSWVTWRLC